MHPLVSITIFPVCVDYWEHNSWAYDIMINASRNKCFPTIGIPGNLEKEGLKTRKDLYYLLHEFGHVYLNHMPGYPIDIEGVLLREGEAWKYAVACLQKKYHTECMQLAEESFETYRKYTVEEDNG